MLNAWAASCPACRAEFPLLAAASAQYGRKVAFLGADTNDSTTRARSSPSTWSAIRATGRVHDLSSLAVLQGLPTTIFIDRAGKVMFVHTGQYESEAALDNDIQHYALGIQERQ